MDRLQLEFAPWDTVSYLDHGSLEQRSDPEFLARLWAGSARVLELDSRSRLRLQPFGAPTSGELPPDACWLGFAAGVAWFARRSANDLPDVSFETELTPPQRQLSYAGAAILNWQAQAHHCSACGGLLRSALGGFEAICTDCGLAVYPRTDPVIIVAPINAADEIYLAHRALRPDVMVSILAGFIEAGESAEQAIHREVAEEAQLQIGAIRYLSSQPWPFPRSLMLGFVARASGVGQVDGSELAWGGWYSRESFAAAIQAGSVVRPSVGSIARTIIDSWWVGRLPAPEAG